MYEYLVTHSLSERLLDVCCTANLTKFIPYVRRIASFNFHRKFAEKVRLKSYFLNLFG